MNNNWQLLIDLAIISILMMGIRRFTDPRSARGGNFAAALALLCAAGVVVLGNPIQNPATVVLALLAGGAAGVLMAVTVNMIQIPAMVAFQHGAGGVAAFLTAFVELTRDNSALSGMEQWSGVIGIVIGAATFSGSVVASAKLAGRIRQTPVILPGHDLILAATLAVICSLMVRSATGAESVLIPGSVTLILLSIILGAVFAVRIGGADMPVLISFLNATAGLAASFCGITIGNRLLIACGATVAASGSILTHVMCRAMNRKLLRVLVAADLRPDLSAPAAGKPAIVQPPGIVATASSESRQQDDPLACAIEAAKNAASVIIIPGYGMALARAQLEVVSLAGRLKQMGKSVKFAIHPIAGRMPGHMHVLLAEAEIDPDIVFDLEEINPEFQSADLVLIVGACDVVNPAAIHVKGTPISGMPILTAHEARRIVVCNMDEKPGYSGVANPLYDDPKTILIPGDARATFDRLLKALS